MLHNIAAGRAKQRLGTFGRGPNPCTGPHWGPKKLSPEAVSQMQPALILTVPPVNSTIPNLQPVAVTPTKVQRNPRPQNDGSGHEQST